MKYTKALKPSLLLLSALAGFVLININLSYSEYNLYKNNYWESAKTKLGKGVWGAWSMMFNKVALKGGELNINAWHGYQELTLKEMVNAEKIEFLFHPCKIPFSFIINKADTATTGIFSYPDREQKISFFIADSTGKFLVCHTKPMPTISGTRRTRAEILITNDSVQIHLNNILVATFPYTSHGMIKPGFRGSSDRENLMIDDIKITSPTGKIIFSDKFEFPFHLHKWSFLYLVFWLLILSYCLYSDRLSGQIVYISYLSAFCIALFFAYSYYYSSGKYPESSVEISWQGAKTSIETEDDVNKRLGIDYPAKYMAGSKRVILLIGSSQTWGAGASSNDKTFAALIQDSLVRFFNDTNIVVINCGISAISLADAFDPYVHKWMSYKPELTVINMSYNDSDTSLFKKSLETFATYNDQHKISTLFIEEPADNNTLPSNNHLIMRSVAGRHHISSIEMQPYLQNYYDTGFLWWDGVHLSDYGHQVFAARIFPVIAAALTQKDAEDISQKTSK